MGSLMVESRMEDLLVAYKQPDKVTRVFDVLLYHLAIHNYFDVSSLFCLRRVCRLTKLLIDCDSVWNGLIASWGLPPSPWAKSVHPCLSRLGLFRDYCYLERHIVLKSPIESRYNDAYSCTVRRIGLRQNCIFVEFSVRGDMSLGALQLPSCSRLDYVLRGNVVNRKRVDRMELTFADERSRFEGFLFFNIDLNRLLECEVYFEYGSGGFSIEKLCTMNRTFCRKNRLMHLTPETKYL